MKYKVGDRVWVKEHKEYGIIKLVRIVIKGGFEMPYYTLDSGFNYLDEDLHETADSMFEELGFKLKETEEYYIYTLKNIY